MAANGTESDLRMFSTYVSPEFARTDDYLRELGDISRWSEEAGCEGILVYTSNAWPDPWLIAQVIIGATERLCPLVALQPAYMHPFSAAKMISTLALLHRRRVHLNLVAGGFKNDLAALNDQTSHDERYGRLEEYVTIMQALLRSPSPISFKGQHYQVNNLKLAAPLSEDLLPDVFISGSSEQGRVVARRLGATAVEYPQPAGQYEEKLPTEMNRAGVRLGVVARGSDEQAWTAAHERFPEDRRGQITHELAMKLSDSSWHRQLSAVQELGTESPYWLAPFKNYKTSCPYLVGSYSRVGDELGRYVTAGCRTFILDTPHSQEELGHIGMVLDRARRSIAPDRT